MMLKIHVYNSDAFTKNGKLKKHAATECGFTMVDVEPHTEGSTDSWLTEVSTKLKKSYGDFSSPYVFTHITAMNKETGKPVYIFEDVVMNGQNVMVSPTKLLKLLSV